MKNAETVLENDRITATCASEIHSVEERDWAMLLIWKSEEELPNSLVLSTVILYRPWY